jgi:transcriptional regulator with XRE-family HTH domain
VSRLLVRFGQRVRKEREARHLSQESFAEECGLHRTYIGSIERGERNVSLINLSVIAKSLHLTLSELVRGIEA